MSDQLPDDDFEQQATNFYEIELRTSLKAIHARDIIDPKLLSKRVSAQLCVIVIFMSCTVDIIATLHADETESKKLIEERLSQTRSKFDTVHDRLIDTMLEDFDEAIESLRGKRDAANSKRFDQLKTAKQRFAEEGTLPLPEILKKPVDTFEKSLMASKKEMEKAYDIGISNAKKQKLDEFAASLASQKQTFEKAFAARHPPRILSRWTQVVARKASIQFDFASDGRIIAPDGIQRTWEINGRSLIIRSPATNAPGGAWVDKCQISADGKTYQGRNQENIEILGTRKLPN